MIEGFLILSFDALPNLSSDFYPKDLFINNNIQKEIYLLAGSYEVSKYERPELKVFESMPYKYLFYPFFKNSIIFVLVVTLDDELGEYSSAFFEAVYRLYEDQRMFEVDKEKFPLKKILEDTIRNVQIYNYMDIKQRLACLILFKYRNDILHQLRIDGSLPIMGLEIQLKDAHSNIPSVLLIMSLIDLGIIKIDSVKILPFEIIYLIKDFVIFRDPPKFIINNVNDMELSKNNMFLYLKKIDEFFAVYSPSDQDSLTLAGVLANFNTNHLLKILRKRILRESELQLLRYDGIDVDTGLSVLLNANVIFILDDEDGEKIFLLLSDITLMEVFPEYVLNTIIKAKNNKAKHVDVLLKHIELLDKNLEKHFKNNKNYLRIKRNLKYLTYLIEKKKKLKKKFSTRNEIIEELRTL